jgi:hypothetical protein
MSLSDTAATDALAVREWRHAQLQTEHADRDDEMLCAGEAVRDWMAWIFEAGPRPHHVMKRLVSCTATAFGLGPVLTPVLTPAERAAVSVVGGERECLRVLGVSVAEVHDALSKAYRKKGRTWDPMEEPTSLDVMTAREDTMEPGESLVRARAVELWLRRVWESGVSFSDALKHLLTDVRALAPELVLNMSGEEIAALFGQGRAAESWRVRRRVNDFLARAGFRNPQLRHQKSLAGCQNYARAQRGNRNRVKGRAAAAAAA